MRTTARRQPRACICPVSQQVRALLARILYSYTSRPFFNVFVVHKPPRNEQSEHGQNEYDYKQYPGLGRCISHLKLCKSRLEKIIDIKVRIPVWASLCNDVSLGKNLKRCNNADNGVKQNNGRNEWNRYIKKLPDFPCAIDLCSLIQIVRQRLQSRQKK